MRFYDAVREILDEDGRSMRNLSESLDREGGYISNATKRGSDAKVETANAILESVGYKLCAVPKADVPEGAYVLGEERPRITDGLEPIG